ncbi:MAG TPA: hypothetical protein VGM03_01525 [Phycisphaerae bacterium]|jgi:Flp pilus assembly pilin Flp
MRTGLGGIAMRPVQRSRCVSLADWLASARAFVREDAGPTATEYAVLLALIVVASVSMITSLGNRHAEIWHAIADATQGSVGGP